MELFLLAAGVLALVLAAALRYARASGGGNQASPPEEEAAGSRMEADCGRTAEALAPAVEALWALMSHPRLGGPGFLTVRFSRQAAVVTAQYPNLREELYRRLTRRETPGAALADAGVPEQLLALEPLFSAESGGMVRVCVQVEGLDPSGLARLEDRRTRYGMLAGLARALERRCPELSARSLGTDLLLSPARETARA